MKPPRAPELDKRRTAEFSAELRERARAWIADWELSDGERDFGRALLEIAARFNSEVAERLDRVGEKMQKGFLDWLAVRGKAAQPARVPVAFALAETAHDAVLASAPVQLQADANGAPVVFETEQDVRIIPGRVAAIIAVDAAKDAYYEPPLGLSDLGLLEPLPTQWKLKSSASAGSTMLQLEPATGLSAGLIIEAGGRHYKITKVDDDLATFEPKLGDGLDLQDDVNKVTSFSPYDGVTRNQQKHALYLGDADLLNIEGEATIEVRGVDVLPPGVTWQYWGKIGESDSDPADWQKLEDDGAQQITASNAISLRKPPGAVEPLELEKRTARWIRACCNTVAADLNPHHSDQLSLRINAGGPDCEHISWDAVKLKTSAVAEAMSNSTPLVISNVFHPLGREPRQFDAFYLGSKEAFSKKNARVQLAFGMADPRFKAMGVVRSGSTDDQIVAGVAADGHLHILLFNRADRTLLPFKGRSPLTPPGVLFNSFPTYRPAIWRAGAEGNFLVAATAKSEVWIRTEEKDSPSASGWNSLGVVQIDSTKEVAGLVHLADASAGWLIALFDAKLFARNLNISEEPWKEIERLDDLGPIEWAQIALIAVEGNNLASELSSGLVGIALDGGTYEIKPDVADPPPVDASFTVTCKKLFDSASQEIAPAALLRVNGRLVVTTVSAGADRQFVSHDLSADRSSFIKEEGNFAWPHTGDTPDIKGNFVDLNITGGALTFAVCLSSGSATSLATWAPQFGGSDTPVHVSEISALFGAAFGTPTLLPQDVLVPTAAGQVLVAEYTPGLPPLRVEGFESVVITETTTDALHSGDVVAFKDGVQPEDFPTEELRDDGIAHSGKRYFALATPWTRHQLLIYKASETFNGKALKDEDDKFTLLSLETDADEPADNSVIRVTTSNSASLYRVVGVDDGVAKLGREMDVVDGDTAVEYQIEATSDAKARPMMNLNPNTNGRWDATKLDAIRLQFPGADPTSQAGVAFRRSGRWPKQIALGERWVTEPLNSGSGVTFVVPGPVVGEWRVQLRDTFRNPELSWEYWNGSGWWTLGEVRDDTLNLKQSGAVRFITPADLVETDWSGKTNHWIRARLIGGDYGQEIATVTTTDKSGGVTEQTVSRSLDGIRAPAVLNLHIAYQLCEPMVPQYVLTQDSGATRDQSDANRTPGAIVEAFVPLKLMLDRLALPSPAAAAGQAAKSKSSPCRCGQPEASGKIETEDIPTPAEPELKCPEDAADGGAQRQLFIGLTACPAGEPVNLFILVDHEQPLDAYTPMPIETLAANRFIPLVAQDTTRALGESGLISLAFAASPTQHDLFGKSGLYWVRMRPAMANSGWTPALRGVYLNAVWASATETLTREPLGSSEGAPLLTVRLARPPVLHDSLELRVREPLGEEERKLLHDDDPNMVRSDVENLPGDWVLWRQVADPGDEAADARVYSLDESTGEIRFGDGRHGKIPPIGRDAIVAFRYCRTEPDPAGGDHVPANLIGPRAALNLVTPLETVESAVTADQTAGGAPPESPDRVLRFGFARLRHRRRAVTARDLEDLARESSPDLVQVRALVGLRRTRLIVVMRGRNPIPNAAQKRELRRVLLAAGPASLRLRDALVIKGPGVRRLRIELRLFVKSLDHAGAVAESVKRRLADYFDTATGGADQTGWAVGANPIEEDVALALLDTPHLESIEDIDFFEVTGDGNFESWPSSLKANEIALLADDPIVVHFEAIA